MVVAGMICAMLLCGMTGVRASAETVSRKTLSADELGKPFAADLEGVETVFSDDFSGTDWSQGGKADSCQGMVEIKDGKLQFPSRDGELVKEHTSYAPILDADLEYQQMELSFEYQWTQEESTDTRWFALMIGCFTSNPRSMATAASDGLWLGISKIPEIPIYGVTSAENGGWAGGAAVVNAPSGITGTRYIKVVTTADYRICLWVADSADGEYVLYADLQANENQVIVKDGNGQEVATLDHDRASTMKGNNFILWTHQAGATIDNLKIRLYGPATQEPDNPPASAEPTATGDDSGAEVLLAATAALLCAGLCVTLAVKRKKV